MALGLSFANAKGITNQKQSLKCKWKFTSPISQDLGQRLFIWDIVIPQIMAVFYWLNLGGVMQTFLVFFSFFLIMLFAFYIVLLIAKHDKDN